MNGGTAVRPSRATKPVPAGFGLAALALLALVGMQRTALAQGSPVDPYPGATMLPEGTIATIALPPAINSRIGPGATPRGIAFPVAGQLLQGTRWRATQSAPATRSPACSRGWIQLFSLEAGQEVVPGNRDVWICRGDGNGTYALLSTGDPAGAATASTPPAAPPSTGAAHSPSAAAPTGAAPLAAAPPAPAPSAAPAPAPAGSGAPVRPSGALIAGANGPDTVTLNWNPSPDATVAGYRIERCTGAACADFREIGTAPRPPFVDARLSPQTTYVYRVRAYTAAGATSEYASPAQVATQPPQQSLPDLQVTDMKAPSSATIGGQMDIVATVTNKGATAAGAYRLGYYFTDDLVTTFTGTFCNMPALPAGASGPCRGKVGVPGSLQPGSYWIVAYADDVGNVVEKDKTNNSAGLRIALAAAPVPTIPVPASLAAAAASATSIRLTWAAPPRGTAAPAGYRIERCTGSGCSSFAQLANETGTAHVDTGLASGTTYVYRIRAYDSAGNSSNYSNTAVAVARPVAALITQERTSQ